MLYHNNSCLLQHLRRCSRLSGTYPHPSKNLATSKILEGYLRVWWSLALGNFMASLSSCPFSCHVPRGSLSLCHLFLITLLSISISICWDLILNLDTCSLGFVVSSSRFFMAWYGGNSALWLTRPELGPIISGGGYHGVQWHHRGMELITFRYVPCEP